MWCEMARPVQHLVSGKTVVQISISAQFTTQLTINEGPLNHISGAMNHKCTKNCCMLKQLCSQLSTCWVLQGQIHKFLCKSALWFLIWIWITVLFLNSVELNYTNLLRLFASGYFCMGYFPQLQCYWKVSVFPTLPHHCTALYCIPPGISLGFVFSFSNLNSSEVFGKISVKPGWPLTGWENLDFPGPQQPFSMQ